MFSLSKKVEIDELNRHFNEFWNRLPEEKKLTVEKANEEALEKGWICNPFEAANIQAIF